MMVFSTPLGFFLAWFKSVVLLRVDAATFAGSLIVCGVCGLVSALILLTAGYGLRIREVTELSYRVRKKLRIVRQ